MYIFCNVSKGTKKQLDGIARKAGVNSASLAGRILRDYFNGRIAYVRVSDRVKNPDVDSLVPAPPPAPKSASSC